MYTLHPLQSSNRDFYIRSYKIILKDFIEILDYIEPSDINLKTYSIRLHGLFMRICIEVEANLKAIMHENGYIKQGSWNMDDYKRVENSHFLSNYDVKYPVWSGIHNIRKPFASFSTNFLGTTATSPGWYKDYHAAKHDRHNEFAKANFENVVDAMAGLVILITSQFMDTESTVSGFTLGAEFGTGDGYDDTIGSYLRIKYPTNMPMNERYDFDWQLLSSQADPFVNFVY